MSFCATSRSSRFSGKGVRSSAEPLAKRFARRGLRGFTLVELMISIAIVLLLMLGVNEVFRLTSSTVAAGQSLSTSLRDQRALRQVMEEDFSRAAADPQVMVITNQAVAAFRTREDELANAGLKEDRITLNPVGDDPRFLDINGDGFAESPGEKISPATPGNRIYRTDTITFFTRSSQRRQTGNLDQNGNAFDLVGSSTSGEALVSYGHLRLPDNSGTQYFDPGEPDYRNTSSAAVIRRNDNNRYASQWILGRRQMLLVEPPSPTGRLSQNETAWYDTGTLDTTATNYGTQNSIGGRSLTTATPTRLDLTPLSMAGARLFNPGQNSAISRNPQTTPSTVYRPHDGRIDVAVTSVSEFARRLGAYEQDVATNPTRYATNGNGDATGPTGSTGLWYLPARSPQDYPEPTAAYGTAPYGANAPETIVYRGKANPFGSRGSKNELADTLAKTAQILVPRCTQFIVEYAGDFVTQDNDPSSRTYGLVTGYGADGEVDFTLEQMDEPRLPGEGIEPGLAYNGVKATEPRKYVTKRVRWYGLPRYVGSGNVQKTNTTPGGYVGPRVRGMPATALVPIQKYDPTTGTSQTVARVRDTTTMPDVVPLSDVLACLAWNKSVTPAVPYGTVASPARHDVAAGVTMAAPFEKIIMTDQTLPNVPGTAQGIPETFYRLENNANTTTGVLNPVNWLPPQQNYADPAQFPLQRANYVVAWNGGGPKLVRITMTLEDPSGRGTPGGQTFEFVFTPSQLAR